MRWMISWATCAAIATACGDGATTPAPDATVSADASASTSADGGAGPDAQASDATAAPDAEAPDAGAEPDAAASPDASPPPAWDPAPEAPPCRADVPAPLLERALAAMGLDRATYAIDRAALEASHYHREGHLADEFLLPWFVEARGKPLRAGCLEGDVAGGLEKALDHAHPVAGMIRHAARVLGARDDGTAPIADDGTDFRLALDAVCLASFDIPCTNPPPLATDVQEALTPILRAIAEGITARRARDPAPRHDAEWWRDFGGNQAIRDVTGQRPNLMGDRAYLAGDRSAVYRAAAQIAYAVEATDWTAFANRNDATFDLNTPAGWIRVRGAGADTHAASNDDTLLFLDLGGDDTYLGEIASNTSGRNAVSIAIDLGGDDRYGYEPRTTPHDRPELLPADDGGRFAGNATDGPLSLSRRSRQGAARNGIAMLFDLGAGRDTYRSLVASQGYAHQGVGVLYDDGGDDDYAAESNAQGAAQYGIALAIDKGGNDTRRAFTQSQGFGFVQGFGALVDRAGDDRYDCDHGDPAMGGVPLYASPQMPGQGNTSMCQGAGFGRRGTNSGTFQSGGVGVLRDSSGDDRYTASVFAQGTGYWQATGILSDGSGADSYDARWYVQGGAAHYALAILADGGPGSDRWNTAFAPANIALGSGHDYSAGVLINEAGDDTYEVPQLSAGAANCNGVGLFVDHAGADAYRSISGLSFGTAHLSAECSDRSAAPTIALFIDADGTDAYPMSLPGDGGAWGLAATSTPTERASAVDGAGEAGVHAESP